MTDDAQTRISLSPPPELRDKRGKAARDNEGQRKDQNIAVIPTESRGQKLGTRSPETTRENVGNRIQAVINN